MRLAYPGDSASGKRRLVRLQWPRYGHVRRERRNAGFAAQDEESESCADPLRQTANDGVDGLPRHRQRLLSFV